MSKNKSQALAMTLLLSAMMGESVIAPQTKLRKFKSSPKPLPKPLPKPRSEEYRAQKKKARAKTKNRKKKRGY